MAKKITGRFDPWRSDPQPVVDEPTARKPSAEPVDFDGPPGPQHCVQFGGLRAGINVWMSEIHDDTEASAHARRILIDLIQRLTIQDDVAKVLRGWGITTGVPKDANNVILREGETRVHISSPGADDPRAVPKAIDNLALALRELSQSFPNVRDTVAAANVRPFIK